MPVDIVTVRVLNATRALAGRKAEWNYSNEMKTLPEDNLGGKEEASSLLNYASSDLKTS